MSAPKRSVDAILADARHVLAKARAHAAEFAAADRGKKKKALPPALVKAFAADVQALDQAWSGQTTRRRAQKTATEAERAARAVVYEALCSIRDDVRASYYDERAVDRAFGTGTRLHVGSTPELLEAAGAVLVAYAARANAKKAKAAGVTPQRIAALRAARRKLAAADTSQSGSIGARRVATAATRALARRVEATTARIRGVARLVLGRGAMAEFKATTPRARSRRKKKQAASTPARGA